jgi:threonine synthase
MVVVQAEGCAPMVRAFERGDERAEPWADPETYAAGLRVPGGIGDHLILGAVRESNGTALVVADTAMAASQERLARLEGIYGAPEGGAVVAALGTLVRSGWIGRDERVVVFNTGSGLKYPDPPGLTGSSTGQ